MSDETTFDGAKRSQFENVKPEVEAKGISETIEDST